MRTEEEIREELGRLVKAIVEETPAYRMMPDDVAYNVTGRCPLSAALMALEWVLGEERWGKQA